MMNMDHIGIANRGQVAKAERVNLVTMDEAPHRINFYFEIAVPV